MLNGIAPIFLFNLFKLTPEVQASVAKIPIVSTIVDAVGLPPIPLYLDERLFGIYIDSENKNIDAETSIETLKSGETPETHQKAVNSTVTINMKASRGSVGLTILSAMMDIIYQKLTSREYSITYLHGAVTVFGGLLHSFSINQNSDNDLYEISITLVRNSNNTIPKTGIPLVEKVTGATPL